VVSTVPITPDVVSWAIDESGLTFEDVSAKVGMDVRLWATGARRPTVGQLRKLAATLRRPLATFFLPKPPAFDHASVEFRHPAEASRGALNPSERRALREARRQQRILSWISEELEEEPVALPIADLGNDTSTVALSVREWLAVSVEDQRQWPSAATAFRTWRDAFENRGVIVLLFAMGPHSCRGFSIWDPRAPVVGINTAFNREARIFSMFHELAHLVSRTSSACLESDARLFMTDAAERWCEEVAAYTLVPSSALDQVLRDDMGPATVRAQVHDLGVASDVARRFRVSIRAATLRLIEARVAGWDLYRAIQSTSDQKQQRGGSSQPRFRARIRREQFGKRLASLFFRAVDAEILDRSDVIDYLDVSDRDLDEIEAGLPAANA
jgi:Zn-dependent peptidase ImmA (M78 family)